MKTIYCLLLIFINIYTNTFAQRIDFTNELNAIIQNITPATKYIANAKDAITFASITNIEEHRIKYKQMISEIENAKKIFKRHDELFKPIQDSILTTDCNEAINSLIRSKDLMSQAFKECKVILIETDKIIAIDADILSQSKNNQILSSIADLNEKQINCIETLNAIISELKECDSH